MIYNYEDILRHIRYTNRKPAYYLNRAFKLVCSELNGRFSSNEYVQMVGFEVRLFFLVVFKSSKFTDTVLDFHISVDS